MRVDSILGLQDTSSDADDVLTELCRTLTPEQKAEKIVSMWRCMQSLARAEICFRRPNLSEREILLRIGSRRIPRHLMIEAFGWDPDVHGY